MTVSRGGAGGFRNLLVFFLDVLKDPHWRPRWRYFHWSVGLMGFLLCTTLMFIIDWIYAIIAWVLTIGILALRGMQLA